MKGVNGQVLTGTSICVDYWLWSQKKKYFHFMTHLHTSDLVNLKSTFRGTIYTSPFNCWLLRTWLNMNPDQVQALQVGDSHLLYDEESGTRFCVTLLEANHCPGSVMFLFQGEFGNILYTGDFRYNATILEHPMLRSLIENEVVDRLYLDNTFAAEHCEFPPQQEALKSVIKLIREHPDHNIILGLKKLGNEEVLRAIALELKEKVCVSEEKLRILTKLRYENVFTTNSEDSRILVTEIFQINQQFINQLRADRGPVITILLTALYSVIPPGAKYSSTSTDTANGIYKIPYSNHSCHSELVKFVSKIKPKEIFPIVSSVPENKVNLTQNNDRSEMCTWQNSVIPKSILKYCHKDSKLDEVAKLLDNMIFKSYSRLENDVFSHMTINRPETSFKNMTSGSKIITSSKSMKEGESQNQIIESKDETQVTNESKELISRINKTAKVSMQNRSQNVWLSKSSVFLPIKPVLSDQPTSEEYFTLSDEEMSQSYVIQEQPTFSDKPERVSKSSYEVVDSLQKGLIDIEASDSNKASSLITNRNLRPNYQANKTKKVHFAPCAQPSTQTCKFINYLTPLPKQKFTTKEKEDEDSERCVSTKPGKTNKITIDGSKYKLDEKGLNSDKQNRLPSKHYKKIQHFIKRNCENVDNLRERLNVDKGLVGHFEKNRTHASQPCKQFSKESKQNAMCSVDSLAIQNQIKVFQKQRVCVAKKKILVENHVLESSTSQTEPKMILVNNIVLKESDKSHDGRQEIFSGTKFKPKLLVKHSSKKLTNCSYTKKYLQNGPSAPNVAKQAANQIDNYEEFTTFILKTRSHSELYPNAMKNFMLTQNSNHTYILEKMKNVILKSALHRKQIVLNPNYVSKIIHCASSRTYTINSIEENNKRVSKKDKPSNKRIEKHHDVCVKTQKVNNDSDPNPNKKLQSPTITKKANLEKSNCFNAHGKRKRGDQYDSEDNDSIRTVSDLEDNDCVIIDMIEKLDKRNYEISKKKRFGSFTLVLEKYNHLLVKQFTNTSSNSGFFSPLAKKIKNKTNNITLDKMKSKKVSQPNTNSNSYKENKSKIPSRSLENAEVLRVALSGNENNESLQKNISNSKTTLQSTIRSLGQNCFDHNKNITTCERNMKKNNGAVYFTVVKKCNSNNYAHDKQFYDQLHNDSQFLMSWKGQVREKNRKEQMRKNELHRERRKTIKD